MIVFLIYATIIVFMLVTLVIKIIEKHPGKFLDLMKKLDDENEESRNK